MEKRLKGKTAIVTGASRGIGQGDRVRLAGKERKWCSARATAI